MCLTSQRIKPFVAKKDLKVFKVLEKYHKNGELGYRTPCQCTPVKLGDTMKPKCDTIYNEFNIGDDGGCKLSVGSGYIHAVIGNAEKSFHGFGSDQYAVEAYIPEGTEYYIGDFQRDVCARELRLTENVVPNEKAVLTDEEMDDILSPIEEFIDNEKVCPGWMVKYDKSFVHPSDYTDSMRDDIIGVVGAVINGNAIVVGLEETRLKWCEDNVLVDNGTLLKYDGNEFKDYEGRKHTDGVLKSEAYKEHKFPAFTFVNEYKTKGTQKGDWYLGAPGELHKMYNENMDTVNCSLRLLKAELVKDDTWYWASAENSSTYAWGCDTDAAVVYYYDRKWGSGYVRSTLSVKLN